MKKILLFIVTVTAAISGFAKDRGDGFTFGVKAGVTANSFIMSKLNVIGLENKMRAGFVVGFTAERPVNSFLDLEADLVISQQGGSFSWDNAGEVPDNKCSVYYLNFPITANFHIVKGLSLKAGLQPGFKIGATINGDSPLAHFEKAGACFNRFDLSIPVGIAYDFSMFRVEARYAVGVTNVFRSLTRVIGEARNSVLSLTFGVKF